MSNFSIAFVTSDEFPHLLPDDQLIVQELNKYKLNVSPAIWDDQNINWSDFNLVIVRSPWDYYLKGDDYENWIRQFINSNTKLLNPPKSILANINKKYLLDFEQQGIAIIPTELVRKNSNANLLEIISRRGWNNVVIKPVVSAGAYGTWRSSKQTAKNDQLKFKEQIDRETVLIQTFMPEIQSEGEWSIIYINGEYSHSVLKSVNANDFRIQEEYGGTTIAVEPSIEILKQTQSIIDKQNEPLLYARVDGVIRDGKFLLMELEINEPSLFFSSSDTAIQKFTTAILAEQAKF